MKDFYLPYVHDICYIELISFLGSYLTLLNLQSDIYDILISSVIKLINTKCIRLWPCLQQLCIYGSVYMPPSPIRSSIRPSVRVN